MRAKKIPEIRILYPTQLIQISLPSECFVQGTSDPKVFHSPGQTHFYRKEEQEVIEQALALTTLMHKEIKSQAVQYGQMKCNLLP